MACGIGAASQLNLAAFWNLFWGYVAATCAPIDSLIPTPHPSSPRAAALGYGGVKYFDLRLNRNSDYVFAYDRMLSPDGDTATYMQYAHARVCSILRKARDVLGADAVDAIIAGTTPAGVTFAHASDVALALELARFQEVILAVQGDLLPHRLCEFLFHLAGRMSDFHRDCYVMAESTPPPVRDARIRLVAATGSVMRTALALLGIKPLERI